MKLIVGVLVSLTLLAALACYQFTHKTLILRDHESVVPSAQQDHRRLQQLVKVGSNWGWGYPLGPCQGDCDNDGECAGHLICFQRKNGDPRPIPGCGNNFEKGTDYCFDPNSGLPIPPPPPPPPPVPQPQPGDWTDHVIDLPLGRAWMNEGGSVANKGFRLILQGDGNLQVVYEATQVLAWESGVRGNFGEQWRVKLQGDCNMKIDSVSGLKLWRTALTRPGNPNGCSLAVLPFNGEIAIFEGGATSGDVVWIDNLLIGAAGGNPPVPVPTPWPTRFPTPFPTPFPTRPPPTPRPTPPPVPRPPPGPWTDHVIDLPLGKAWMNEGGSVANKGFRMILQGDGNLQVVYEATQLLVWESGVKGNFGEQWRVKLQGDCNMKIDSVSGLKLWRTALTRPGNPNGCSLVVLPFNGEIAIFQGEPTSGHAVWIDKLLTGPAPGYR